MRKIIILLIAVFITLVLKSQEDSLFNYNYPLAWQYDCVNMTEHNGIYYLSGNIARTTETCEYWLFGYHISKINETGAKDTTVIFDKCEYSTYVGWKGSGTVIGDTLITFGMSYDENQNHKMFVLQNTLDLDTIRVNYYYEDTLTKRSISCNVTNDDNLILCGQVDSTRNENSGTPEITFTKAYLLKVSLIGETIWSKDFYFGDIADGCWSIFTQVISTYDKGYITIGRSSDFGNSKNLILKTDSLGNQQWVKFFGSSSYSNPTFTDIIETQDSCYIVCGAYTYGETFGGLYPYDGWLLKLDINGNLKWDKKYRDYVINNTDWRDTIRCNIVSITELNDKGFAGIAEVKSSECMGKEFRIYRFDSIGDLLWSKLFTEFSECNNTYHCNSIIQSDDGGFAISGHMDHYEWNIIGTFRSNRLLVFFLQKPPSIFKIAINPRSFLYN